MAAEAVWDFLPMRLVGPVTFLLFTVAFYLAGRLVVRPLVKHVVRNSRVDDGLAIPLSRFLLYLTVLVGAGVGLVAGGYENVLGVLGTIIAAATVAIGFAMKDTLSAFMGGVFIFVDKPFRIGHTIQWDDEKGRVVDIRLRTTKIETLDNELMTVPNDKITNATVINFSARSKHRNSLTFRIGYDNNIEQAKHLIRSSVTDIEGVLDDPAPSVHITDMNGSTVTLQLMFWTKTGKRPIRELQDDVFERVKAAFQSENITLS